MVFSPTVVASPDIVVSSKVVVSPDVVAASKVVASPDVVSSAVVVVCPVCVVVSWFSRNVVLSEDDPVVFGIAGQKQISYKRIRSTFEHMLLQ